MPDALLLFASLSATLIERERLTFPVRVELLDGGTNPIFQMTATAKNDEGVYQWTFPASSVLAVPTGSYSVRFTDPANPPHSRITVFELGRSQAAH